MKLHRKTWSRCCAAIVGLGMLVGSAGAMAESVPTHIRFVLDWKIQGVHSWFYWALDKGYFKAAGLDVSIDQGNGSAAVISDIATGAYQAGFGDENSVIQYAAQHPGTGPVGVYMIYNRAPFAIITKAGSPTRTLKDLEGKTVGSPAGGAAREVFTALAAHNGINASKVNWLNMAPNLQEQMLLRGQVDASAVFSATSYINLLALNVNPDKDIRWFFYNDYGLDLYSNAVVVSRQLVQSQPAAVKGLVGAINHAMKDCIANPDACVDNLMTHEPLLNRSIERRRLVYVLQSLILTPEEQHVGLGDVDDARMSRAIAQIAQSYGLQSRPQSSEVFDRDFLPPRAERTAPASK
ncbi:ABC transporter substrate-binding protein [Paraburkholderia fungorum]|uniref:ABC transporter substrate-binding protein n=1 Tax=Paraburkholderia fungorum TaxID=134537 RepID=UPI0038B76B46